MMYDAEKSDPAIVAQKRANKDATASAELVERRAGPEGNPGRRATCRAQQRASVQQAAERIRAAAKRKPAERLVALLHHITVEALESAYHALRRDAAAGVDGVTWEAYAEGLEDRLIELHGRVRRGAYRAPPSRRVYSPKEDGGQRPLGIAALEDKVLQRAVTDTILAPI
jgi:retron-type reverse transcriptase